MKAKKVVIMESVICFVHPEYDGIEAPDLKCKNCCAKFIYMIREKQKKRLAQTRKKPFKKADLVRSVKNINQTHRGIQVNPESI